MSLLRLPPELIEQILIELVLNEGPNDVAAVAACCRFLNVLVSSNWRDLFLTMFDDPRSKDPLKACGPGLPKSGLDGMNISNPAHRYDWHKFTNRVAAANRLAAADPACDFQALVDVLDTAAHIPRGIPLDPVVRRPIVFPPLLGIPKVPASNNISWLNKALGHGYPPLLTKRLMALFDPEGPACSRAEFEDTPQGKAFCKLAFLRGFIPTAKESEHQFATARAVARTRVYCTQYLMPERCWGPFQPLDPNQPHVYSWRNRLIRALPPNSDSQDADVAIRSASGSRNCDRTFHPSSIVLAPSLLDPDDDIDDPDYDPDDSDAEDVHGDTPHLLHFLSSHGIDFADNRTHPTYVFPAPHRVIPDYAFLAAARCIMEANLREKIETEVPLNTNAGSIARQAAADVGLDVSEVVDVMQSLDLTRMGGAPGFWDVWRPEKLENDEDEATPAAAGKGKMRAAEDSEVEGWDWAGVEGEWRRVVCWLDYRDLLMHNVDITTAGFGIDDLQETIRIFPMTLHVAGYSPPPRPPPGADPKALIWMLPVIHVVGDSRGTDTDESTGRVIEGTVRMIGDGAVRWSMTSSEAAGSDPEWVTESVQVGDIGSAIGMIGLWTGAEHSSTDPLGPCWAWKVA
ncbi:hypothetical protein B0H15DRAFT_814162 [Mycena belliarum]|uniref:F-box domain-containing protein n=1 Tax=Mycena belliarum TaxID=1033014 RepID=A0AAD6UIA0_9AGAR|nr:hypothetical protein B0H15DRAFT_814162 [Mycena belliae]